MVSVKHDGFCEKQNARKRTFHAFRATIFALTCARLFATSQLLTLYFTETMSKSSSLDSEQSFFRSGIIEPERTQCARESRLTRGLATPFSVSKPARPESTRQANWRALAYCSRSPITERQETLLVV